MAIGQLLFPNQVTLAFLQTRDMEAAGKYDHILREPIPSDTDSDGVGEVEREETQVTLDGQTATFTFGRVEQREAGQVPETRDLEITFHRNDLEDLNLLLADGSPKIQPGVRLVKVETPAGGSIQEWSEEPFLYVTAVRFSGFFGALAVCTFSDRRKELGDRQPLQK